MDRLEKFIRAHRDQFDDRSPDPALWDRIAGQLPVPAREHKRVLLWKRVAAAAVVLALVMSGVVAGMYMGRGSAGSDPAYADFMQAQHYYSVEYNKKKSELAQYTYDPEVDKDLQELDRMYKELSDEFEASNKPNKTELVNAMIQLYKTRIQLLERVLNKIEQSKTEKPTFSEDENVKI